MSVLFENDMAIKHLDISQNESCNIFSKWGLIIKTLAGGWRGCSGGMLA